MDYTTPRANVVTNPLKADSTVTGDTADDPGDCRPPRKFAAATFTGDGGLRSGGDSDGFRSRVSNHHPKVSQRQSDGLPAKAS